MRPLNTWLLKKKTSKLENYSQLFTNPNMLQKSLMKLNPPSPKLESDKAWPTPISNPHKHKCRLPPKKNSRKYPLPPKKNKHRSKRLLKTWWGRKCWRWSKFETTEDRLKNRYWLLTTKWPYTSASTCRSSSRWWGWAPSSLIPARLWVPLCLALKSPSLSSWTQLPLQAASGPSPQSSG